MWRDTAVTWKERKYPRTKVLIRAQMRAGGLPVDVCIRDASSSGALIQASTAPSGGTIIELLGPFPPIVGRVVWANGRRFGIITQDRIDVPALLSREPDRGRLTQPTPYKRRSIEQGEERARLERLNIYISRCLQYAATLLIGGAVAVGLSGMAYAKLQEVSAAVRAGLQG